MRHHFRDAADASGHDRHFCVHGLEQLIGRSVRNRWKDNRVAEPHIIEDFGVLDVIDPQYVGAVLHGLEAEIMKLCLMLLEVSHEKQHRWPVFIKRVEAAQQKIQSGDATESAEGTD